MRNKTIRVFASRLSLLIMALGMQSCASTKEPYHDRYAEAWKKVLQSEAWKSSLIADNSNVLNQKAIQAADSGETLQIYEKGFATIEEDPDFMQKYHTLATRAYVKIIAEAEDANERLKSEYDLWKAKESDTSIIKSHEFKNKIKVVNRKYYAHRQMLEGLKSWNIFSEYGTDDLKFFKKENLQKVYDMIKKGKSDHAIIGFLVYRLADLYHFQA